MRYNKPDFLAKSGYVLKSLRILIYAATSVTASTGVTSGRSAKNSAN
jgi:hypothetical protein